MKKWGINIAITVLTIFLIVSAIYDFVVSEPIHYFSDQPLRLSLVACIAIGGGFAMLGFNLLSFRSRRRIKLFAFGAIGLVLLMAAVYSLIEFVVSSIDRTPFNISRGFLLIALGLVPFILLMALQFYQTLKMRVE